MPHERKRNSLRKEPDSGEPAQPLNARSISGLAKVRAPSWLKVTHKFLGGGGFEDDQTKAKHTAANRWVEAVNNWGQLRRWAFHVCRNPQLLDKEMEYLARAESVRPGLDRTFRGEL